MTMTVSLRSAALAILVAAASVADVAAQSAAVGPHHPDPTLTQPRVFSTVQGMGWQGGMPGQWGMMPPMGPGMMGQGMIGQGPMNGLPMMAMRGQVMKIMFAIADMNGDGGLSFDEVMAIHKRIFDSVDANKDGKVVPDEVQAFMTP